MTPDLQTIFYVKDCALAAIATGERAGSLVELRDKLSIVPPGCIYYHFWGGRLFSQFAHPEDHNDFASWVRHVLHDLALAEKLAVFDPTEYKDLEELRQDILNIIEDRIDEKDMIVWSKKEQLFHFIRSKIIVFDTPLSISQPNELLNLISSMTLSSIFYHFIDARRRTDEGVDDFSVWLKYFGEEYQELIHKIQNIDIYFLSLSELKQKLLQITSDFLKTHQKLT